MTDTVSSIPPTTSKPAMLAVFKPNYPKSTISGIVQIGDQQSYQAQPVTLTILNSPSITTSTKGTICLSNTSAYGNILVKSESSETSASESNTSHTQAQSHNILNTVVVSSSTPNSHGSIQYLVPALQNIYVPQTDIQIPASGTTNHNISIHQYPVHFLPKSCAQSVIVTQSPALNTFVSQHNNTSSQSKPIVSEENEYHPTPTSNASESNHVKFSTSSSKFFFIFFYIFFLFIVWV